MIVHSHLDCGPAVDRLDNLWNSYSRSPTDRGHESRHQIGQDPAAGLLSSFDSQRRVKRAVHDVQRVYGQADHF